MPSRKKLAVSVLEKQGISQILVALHNWKETRKANMTDLKKLVKAHNQTIQADIILLKRMGLVDDEKAKKLPYEHTVWLTAKGQEVAMYLFSAGQLLDSSQPKQEFSS
jgi:DNA-binding HxlR family transcriptional regulator